MTTDKDGPAGRQVREGEIFADGPGAANYSSSIGAEQGLESFGGSTGARRARPNKPFAEPARNIPVYGETDVLVVGGGPAGTAAAVAAARLGAGGVLGERDNPLGGVSTRRAVLCS